MKRDWKTQKGIRTRLSHGCRSFVFFGGGIWRVLAVGGQKVLWAASWRVELSISGVLGITRSRKHVDRLKMLSVRRRNEASRAARQ